VQTLPIHLSGALDGVTFRHLAKVWVVNPTSTTLDWFYCDFYKNKTVKIVF